MKAKIASNRGWQFVECRQYGQVVRKWIKWFGAASKLTKGKPVKVVLVKENEKVWVPLVSTDATMEAKEILESDGVRFGIEEVVKDLKEIWGWGKPELRLLESNEAATTNMLLYDMVELSTWDRTAEELVDRRSRPWDDANRRNDAWNRLVAVNGNMFYCYDGLNRRIEKAVVGVVSNLESTGCQ